MEWFRLLLEHLESKHEFLSGIRDSRMIGSLVRDDERCGRSKEVNTLELIDQGVRVRVVTKVIDTVTQEDLHEAFQKLLERYNKCIAAGGDYFEGD